MREFLKKNKLEIIVLSCSVLIVLAFCIIYRIHALALGRDSINYIGHIELWHSSGSIDGVLEVHEKFWFPPLSLFFAKLLVDCGIEAETAAVSLNIFFACFLPLIVFGIAKMVTESTKIALCSAVLLSFNPSIIELAVEAQRDMPYLFFCGLMIYFVCAAIRNEKWFYWCAAGICFSISFLIRYETLEMLPIFCCYFLALLIIRKGARLKQLLCALVLMFTILVSFFALLGISGTTEYVLKQYQVYYEGKLDLMLEKTGELYE